MTSICWNEAKTVGIICEDDQLAYELRKGAMNPLGIVTPAFMDAWGDMTADDNCTIEKIDKELMFRAYHSVLILHTMTKKAGLLEGARVALELFMDIGLHHPEFAARLALTR